MNPQDMKQSTQHITASLYPFPLVDAQALVALADRDRSTVKTGRMLVDAVCARAAIDTRTALAH